MLVDKRKPRVEVVAMSNGAWRCRALPACVAVALVFGLSGCSHAPSRDSSASAALPSQADIASVPSVDATSRDDLIDETDLAWTRYAVVTPTSVRIFFNGANPSCYGVRTIVDESVSTVTISLRQGTLPQASDQCPLLAYQGSVLVSLGAPLGDRTIAHG
jgi:hypothetical protein